MKYPLGAMKCWILRGEGGSVFVWVIQAGVEWAHGVGIKSVHVFSVEGTS